MVKNLIYIGAEAEIWKSSYLGLPCIEKIRIPKKYRIAEIDEKIRKERIKKECKMIISSRKAVDTPHIYDVDLDKNIIILEFIKGEKIKDLFLRGKKTSEIGNKIGKAVAKLHDTDLIHNDLTTSNMILKDNRIYFIDFGLGFKSKKIEDKATDLLVFKRMLKSTHWKFFDKIWSSFKAGYGNVRIIRKMEEIEHRARYM